MSTIKKKPASRLSDAFVRSPDCATYLVDLKLPPELWAVFALAEQPVTAEQVVARAGLDLETAKLALRRLARRKLIQKHIVGWQDYINASPAITPVAPPSVPAPAIAPMPTPAPAIAAAVAVATAMPAVVVASPAPVPPAPALVRLSAAPKPVVATEIVFTLRSASADARRRSAAAGQIEFKLARVAATPAKAETGRKLRPILDAIIEKGGGGLQGQLLAYRVFLRIPSEIAAAAGLSSLSLVDDDFTVQDPRLIDALFEAARTVAGLESLPQAA